MGVKNTLRSAIIAEKGQDDAKEYERRIKNANEEVAKVKKIPLKG